MRSNTLAKPDKLALSNVNRARESVLSSTDAESTGAWFGLPEIGECPEKSQESKGLRRGP